MLSKNVHNNYLNVQYLLLCNIFFNVVNICVVAENFLFLFMNEVNFCCFVKKVVYL